MKFNSITAIKYLGKNKWDCLCECGYSLVTYQSSLKRGQIKSCPKCSEGRLIKKYGWLIGESFGKWKVIGYKTAAKRTCQCECGTVSVLRTDTINRTSPKACRKCSQVRKTIFEGNGNYGEWLVLDRKIIYKKDKDLVLCKCKCGKKQYIEIRNLLNGLSTGCRSCALKKEDGWAALTKIICHYKAGARNRNIEWGLNNDEVKKIISSNCHYTGLPPSTICTSKGGSSILYNGIDRLDSKKGYFLENCVPCNSTVNKMKMALPYSEFINYCALITEHMKNKSILQHKENKLKAV